ncbi:hypothetical protein GIB67_032139 [Kingdonia uniflora]|uniref:Uncharacterized protein n=1 Tax=Kingdonia uniflora TaxID=39325 RepID=A0A7J7MXE2_9MAGN|nr:hypothetical protein GIB67_032139 [Kingdonia uniflora]
MQENSLGIDVSLKNPDKIASSFVMQLKYAENPSLDFSFSRSSQNSEVMPEDLDDFPDNGFRNLKNTFKDLGICMMELELRLAQVCDRAIAWDKTLSISQHLKEKLISNEQCSRACDEIGVSTSDAISLHLNKKVMLSLIEEINGIVPPLSSRLKDGMIFAEFSRETTKQYYGGNGMQSKI